MPAEMKQMYHLTQEKRRVVQENQTFIKYRKRKVKQPYLFKLLRSAKIREVKCQLNNMYEITSNSYLS